MQGITLSNGVVMPYIGYGTGVVNHYSTNFPVWAKHRVRLILNSVKNLRINRQIKIDMFASQMVRDAYNSGFRLFDTGRIYGDSEIAISKGLKNVQRENYFLCTKFSDLCYEMNPQRQDVLFHLKKSLSFLQTDYVDLLCIHHPHGDVAKIWAEMEKAYESGLCRAIGTSNFNVSDFAELKKTQKIAPMVNQGERHPFFTNNEVFEYCRQNNILFMAHTPTGRGTVSNSDLLSEIGRKYGKTNSQIVLRWHNQNGVVPVVSTTNKEHMEQSNDIFDFELFDEMSRITNLNNNVRMLDCLNGVDNPLYRFNR
ncbi:MAG TPA: aldo/keto reductase [Bacteroidales bacterium]|nr:aldo/keto reductase [Bacteroidales bacterium]